MTDIRNEQRQDVLAFYGHLSRMYNAGFGALVAVIFGWLTFVGINTSLTYPVKYVGLVICAMTVYFYIRLLFFMRWMNRIHRDLGLNNYTRGLPDFLYLQRLNERKKRLHGWTLGEVSSSVLLILLFSITLCHIYLNDLINYLGFLLKILNL